MEHPSLRRRAFLGSTAAAAFGAGIAARPGTAAANDPGAAFRFEIIRTEDEWRARLTDEEYVILRRGSTELPNTSPLVTETAEGIYCCRGCDLTVYTSTWKVPLEIGWVFFSHAEPRSVLTSIDGEPPDGMGDDDGPGAMIEVHCRRCASHLGHIVIAEGLLLHCINGTALQFRDLPA
ncbi:MAG: peptide-methionine (R)-S-oxide reductase [Pseudomonadota bacterium]